MSIIYCLLQGRWGGVGCSNRRNQGQLVCIVCLQFGKLHKLGRETPQLRNCLSGLKDTSPQSLLGSATARTRVLAGGRGAMFEEVCHWGRLGDFKCSSQAQSLSLFLLPADSSCLPVGCQASFHDGTGVNL